jgi:hypothetical protein
MLSPPRFWIVLAAAAMTQLSVAYAYASAPLQFIVLLVLWNVAPMVVAAILFVASARYAAWGWLIATALYGLWAVVAVLQSDRSTAALGFMWAPVWSFIFVGPIGAGVAIFLAKLRSQRKANSN